MYYPGDSHNGTPAHGNPLWQTTVNPANLSLAQPSHGPIHPYAIPYNVAPTDYNFVGYLAVANTPQGATPCYPAWSPQSMSDTSGQCSDINDVPVEHSTLPVGKVSRGLSACQWVLEDGSICARAITGETVPKHLAEHGVQRMPRKQIVRCGWYGCKKYRKRHGVTRHVREVHLGLKRKCHKARFAKMTLVTHKL